MIMVMTMMFFWAVTPCRLASSYHRFREIYCHCLLPWRWRQHVSPKRRYLPATTRGVTCVVKAQYTFTAKLTSHLPDLLDLSPLQNKSTLFTTLAYCGASHPVYKQQHSLAEFLGVVNATEWNSCVRQCPRCVTKLPDALRLHLGSDIYTKWRYKLNAKFYLYQNVTQ
jgi:hypothetical protein